MSERGEPPLGPSGPRTAVLLGTPLRPPARIGARRRSFFPGSVHRTHGRSRPGDGWPIATVFRWSPGLPGGQFGGFGRVRSSALHGPQASLAGARERTHLWSPGLKRHRGARGVKLRFPRRSEPYPWAIANPPREVVVHSRPHRTHVHCLPVLVALLATPAALWLWACARCRGGAGERSGGRRRLLQGWWDGDRRGHRTDGERRGGRRPGQGRAPSR